MRKINFTNKQSRAFITIAFFAIAFLQGIAIHAQTITTVAGTGTAGSTGDGGAATAAEISYPRPVAVDAAGNIYINDWSFNGTSGFSTIRKITVADGSINTIAGSDTVLGYSGDNGPATAAQINGIMGIAIDIVGNVYLADANNNRIRKIDTAGIITTVAGNGVPTYAGDNGPATAASLSGPYSVSFDAVGNMYIADNGNGVIRKVDTSGTISTVAGNYNIYGYSGDNGPATAAGFISTFAVVFDVSGNMYILDNDNNNVRKVDTAGIISTVAGDQSIGNNYSGDNGPATAAALNNPFGLAIDASGNLLIGDTYNQCIRMVNTAGIITTIAGNNSHGYSGDNGLATAAELNYPYGVTVDALGNTYIADYFNQRIRKISPPPCNSATAGIITISGNTTFCGSGSDTILLTGASTGNGISHQWQSSTDGTNWINVGTDTARYITGTITDTTYYRSYTACSFGSIADTSKVDTIIVSPVVLPTASIGTSVPNPVCPNTLVTFNGSITNGGLVPQYQWQKNGIIVSSGINYTDSSVADKDTIILTVTSNVACATQPTATDTLIMDVTPTVIPVATLSASPGNTVSAGTMVTFTATVTDGGSAPIYQWRKNGTDIPSATASFYATATLANNDQISCWVHGNGTAPCTDTAAVLSDTITMHIGMGIASLPAAERLSLYPNPNNGQFMLTGTTDKDEMLNIAIIDITGRIVQEQTINAQHGQFSSPINAKNTCAEGMYLLRITSKNGSQFVPFSVSK